MSSYSLAQTSPLLPAKTEGKAIGASSRTQLVQAKKKKCAEKKHVHIFFLALEWLVIVADLCAVGAVLFLGATSAFWHFLSLFTSLTLLCMLIGRLISVGIPPVKTNKQRLALLILEGVNLFITLFCVVADILFVVTDLADTLWGALSLLITLRLSTSTFTCGLTMGTELSVRETGSIEVGHQTKTEMEESG